MYEPPTRRPTFVDVQDSIANAAMEGIHKALRNEVLPVFLRDESGPVRRAGMLTVSLPTD